MIHELHKGPRVVFGDDCDECVSRCDTLDGLAALDRINLVKLGALAARVVELRRAGLASRAGALLGASYVDMRAVDVLLLAARLVHGSGITEEDAR